MSQGDPLAMVDYGIGILPLIKNMKAEFPDDNHPWYADDVGALGKFSRIKSYFNSLKRLGPGGGYYQFVPALGEHNVGHY